MKGQAVLFSLSECKDTQFGANGVYQNPEYRTAEEAVRVKVAERIKNQSPTKPAASGLLKDFN